MRGFVFTCVYSLVGALVLLSGCDGNSSATTGGGDAGSAGSGAAAGAGGTGGTGGEACQPATEICDGKDNDCDGQIDNVSTNGGVCDCHDGDTQDCYTGPDGTAGVGACAMGQQTCAGGIWGECTGEVLPTPEDCNLQDDDCNGQVDDMGMSMCGVGACAASVETCVNGQLQQCVPGQPALEVCDGIDNNCNQLVDETDPMIGQACLTGQPGVCATGKQACAGQVLTCVPDFVAETEACDGKDNDCDGTVDNDVPGTGADCSTGMQGPCSAGTVSCQNGVVDCFSTFTPGPETCDGVDNDCNGTVDDPPGVNMPCDTGLLGACQAGIQQCQNGTFGCVQQVQAQATDTCGDNIDNDCDGTVDEGCLYTFSGVAQNVPIASLTGWTQCYIDTYANGATSLTTILAQCSKAKLLLACRPTGSQTLTLAAHAPRLDVIFDTGGTTSSVPHDANGVGWYYNSTWSWGFAPQGDPISLNSCDTQASSLGAGVDGDKRMCWHTGSGNINGGWRCGTVDSIFGSTYERLVFHAD